MSMKIPDSSELPEEGSVNKLQSIDRAVPDYHCTITFPSDPSPKGISSGVGQRIIPIVGNPLQFQLVVGFSGRLTAMHIHLFPPVRVDKVIRKGIKNLPVRFLIKRIHQIRFALGVYFERRYEIKLKTRLNIFCACRPSSYILIHKTAAILQPNLSVSRSIRIAICQSHPLIAPSGSYSKTQTQFLSMHHCGSAQMLPLSRAEEGKISSSEPSNRSKHWPI